MTGVETLPLASVTVTVSAAGKPGSPLMSDTLTGLLEEMAELLPNWPLELYPQHVAPPVVVTAHAWAMPAEMEATPLPRPYTGTGTWDWVTVPSPSRP